MAQKLSRAKLTAICKAYDGGELGARSFHETAAPTVFLIKNAGLSSINEGAPLTLSGFATSSLAYSKAVARLNNGSLTLGAVTPGSSSDVHAIALERVAPGKVGSARSVGVCFHTVTINDASHGYADASFNSVASGGFYTILAKSATSNGKAVCALYHSAQGGGGGTLQASVSNNVLTLEIV